MVVFYTTYFTGKTIKKYSTINVRLLIHIFIYVCFNCRYLPGSRHVCLHPSIQHFLSPGQSRSHVQSSHTNVGQSSRFCTGGHLKPLIPVNMCSYQMNVTKKQWIENKATSTQTHTKAKVPKPYQIPNPRLSWNQKRSVLAQECDDYSNEVPFMGKL